MNSLVSTPEEQNKKFVPKRRAPYLLHNEFINGSINKNIDSIIIFPKESDNKESSKGLKDESTIKVSNKVPENNLLSKSTTCIQNSVDIKSNYHEEISKLCGIQKRIIRYFVGCCMIRGESITGPITIEILYTIANTTKKTLKKVIQRVIKKGFMKRSGGKTGKSGFSIFSFDNQFINIFKLHLDLENSQKN